MLRNPDFSRDLLSIFFFIVQTEFLFRGNQLYDTTGSAWNTDLHAAQADSFSYILNAIFQHNICHT